MPRLSDADCSSDDLSPHSCYIKIKKRHDGADENFEYEGIDEEKE